MRPRTSVAVPREVRVLSGELAAPVIENLVSGMPDVTVVAVRNNYFGGNTGVAGLLTFADVSEACGTGTDDVLFLLPDVCLNSGMFLDGRTIEDLGARVNVEVVPASGTALRERLESFALQREKPRNV
jgi:NifB/MoaA-like Fe-S oxidoreductase